MDSLPPLLQSVYGGYSAYQQVTSKLNYALVFLYKQNERQNYVR